MKDTNETPPVAPTDGSPAAPGGQPASVTPTPTPPPPGTPVPPANKLTGKTGWIVAIVLLILLLLGGLWWWMMYNQGANDTTTPSTNQEQSSGSDGSDGSNGTDGSSGSSGSDGSSSAIDGLSASVQNGQNKATVEGNAGGLEPNCVGVDTGGAAESQEVCTYQDGTKTLKVTYQDDEVVDVTRTGF